MLDDVSKDIKVFLENHVDLLEEEKDSVDDWFIKEEKKVACQLNLLKELANYLQIRYGKFYSLKNLYLMMRLYELYPKELPYELKVLPWEIIKILVSIYDEGKREFFIDVCFFLKVKPKQLKWYIRNEVYERFLDYYDKYYDKDHFTLDDYRFLMGEVIKLANFN